jgi:chemotaxis protein histidine kinase CheA
VSIEPSINDESEGISKRLAAYHAQSEIAASAAGVAKESAESAATAATTAKNTADAAATAAASAKVAAEAASVAATTAKNSAETEATAVTTARTTAEAAAVAATNAKNTAEPASAAAVTAKGTAETAAAAATTAKNTAEPAANAAAIAKGTAEAAAAAAASAKSTAETEANAALNAKALADGAATAAATFRNTAENEAAAITAAKIPVETAAADIAAAKEAAISASQNAIGAEKRSEQAAIAADARLQEIRHTLENSITASLGGAFQLKANNAKKLDLAWLVVLMIGIAGIICFGLLRYPAMVALIQERAEVEYLIFQFMLSIASLAGPIWLSWVATKRLARTFAISEDYAYKAAIAQAYQGYRDSVKDADPLMQQRLFASVVTQLDANPVRFLSDRHAATPIQDLLQQPWMEQIINTDKTFKEKLTAWFKYTYGTFLGDKG